MNDRRRVARPQRADATAANAHSATAHAAPVDGLSRLQANAGNVGVNRLLEGARGSARAGPEEHVVGRITPSPVVVRRVLDIENDLTYETIDALPKGVAVPKRARGREAELIRQLDAWAREPRQDGKPTHVFPNWIVALDAVLKELDAAPTRATLPVNTPTAAPKEKTYKRRQYTVADDITSTTVKKSEPRTIWFTADGSFSDSTGKRLSKPEREGLTDRLQWKHIYQGHGPQMTEEQVKQMSASVDANDPNGVAGKWMSDAVVLKMVKRVHAEVAAGTVVPGRAFNTFPIPRDASLNYRFKDGWFYKLEATEGVVAFHKAVGEGDRWSIRTMYPRPPLLKDLGDLSTLPRTAAHGARQEPKEPKQEKADKKKTVGSSSSQAKGHKRSRQRKPKKTPQGRPKQQVLESEEEPSSGSDD
jgi:hypothetical protein